MTQRKLIEALEFNPVIAAVHEADLEAALASPVEVIFDLKASLLSVRERVLAAHKAGKIILVHIDLAEGIG